MTLSQPPPTATCRVASTLQLLDPIPIVGQRLVKCEGHHWPFTNGDVPCYGGPGNSVVADAAWWPFGDMPAHVLDAMTPVCWLKVRRRKDRASEWRRALQWRRDNEPVGYRNLANFEAAAHWWLCTKGNPAERFQCSCTIAYVCWFADELRFGALSSTIWQAATGEAP